MDTNATTAPVAPDPAPPTSTAGSNGATPTPQAAPTDRTAAEKADSQARTIAVLAAVVPTVLAAQGMILFAADVLGLPLQFAWMLACFLELALVAAAMLDRAAAVRGRSSKGISTWVFSGVSGCLSALHELVQRTPSGGSEWTTGPIDILAALIRIAAPLVAAYLWHRVLIGLRYTAEGKTEIQAKRDKRMHAAARAAQELARAEKTAVAAPGFLARRRVRAAERKRDRTWDRVLAIYPASEETMARDFDRWLRAIGAADLFAKRTDVTSDDGLTLEAATAVPTTSAPKRRPTPKRTTVQPAPKQEPAKQQASPSDSPAPKPVAAAPANVRQLTARTTNGASDRDRAQELFDQIVSDPAHPGKDRDGKPIAKYIHDTLGLTHDDATTRRWVGKMWKTLQDQELPPSTPPPDDIDQLVADTTPAPIQQAREA